MRKMQNGLGKPFIQVLPVAHLHPHDFDGPHKDRVGGQLMCSPFVSDSVCDVFHERIRYAGQ
ncbi:hypothetical protein EI42_05916 [Thermosporothrix hazakensis]|uniref:Uncharacterized protein n=1 Tax=Thermosporothrix hazakensis TaxID=644383 RepID=A0A326TV93_THEHA|nr:hypothetical protein EI42_05916 [Thermosporothrix hazakensis]